MFDKDPLKGVYIMNAIYGLAGSFVGIFIPIYLLEKNLNPANVFWFYLVYTVAILVFFFSPITLFAGSDFGKR